MRSVEAKVFLDWVTCDVFAARLLTVRLSAQRVSCTLTSTILASSFGLTHAGTLCLSHLTPFPPFLPARSRPMTLYSPHAATSLVIFPALSFSAVQFHRLDVP
jgi:hypothetical protein